MLVCARSFPILLVFLCHVIGVCYQVLVRAFPGLLSRYYDAFAAWKEPDGAMLTTRIGNALVMLRFAALAIPADVPQDDPQRVAFHDQITELRTRLLAIRGEVGLAAFDQDVNAETEFNGAGLEDGDDEEEVEDEDEDHDDDSKVSFDTRDNWIRRSPRGPRP